jgi:hypothetical protein
MNFQNFYILIFRKDIKPKIFVGLFITFYFIVLSSSFILNKLDITINDNDVIRKYQLSKIYNTDFQDVSTIIVGDSSGGNAINNKYFSELTKQKTENLCLTGSWGILGDLGILKKALEENKNINNVIIIHTLDIWGRNYPKESMFELFSTDEIKNNMSLNSLFSYYFNPKEIWWYIKYLINKIFNINSVIRKIDLNNDYLGQGDKKYSNGLSIIDDKLTLNNQILSDAKLKELNMLQDFCHENNINCIFANGPIDQTISNNSIQFYDYLKSNIHNKFTITHIDKIFEYDNHKMGDESDHMDIKYKDATTYDYFLEINKYLQ